MNADLLLRLDRVRGLDPVGLAITADEARYSGVCVRVFGTPANDPRVSSTRSSCTMSVYPRGGGHCAALPPSEVSVSLADSAARDRVARWVAERVGMPCDPVAGFWRFVLGAWRLTGSDGAIEFGAADPEAEGRFVVHALSALDPHDDTRLPDGSRLVDALALAAVARHVGSGS